MNKISSLKKYLSGAGFSYEANSLNSLVKEASEDYITAYYKILEMLEVSFPKLEIKKSEIENKHIEIAGTRFFNLEIMKGSEISCKQNLLIRVFGPIENQKNITYSVKSELHAFGTLFGDFESTMSKSATEEERRLSRSGIDGNIKKMIDELIADQHNRLISYSYENLDT